MMIFGPVVVTGGSGGIGSELLVAFRDYFTRRNHLFPPVSAPHHTDLPDSLALENARVLVCCHAAPPGSTLADSLLADVALTDAVVRRFASGVARTGGGRVILFSSIRAAHPRPGQAAYAATKAAIEGLTRGLAVELGPLGITVNCIAPGAVETPRTRLNIERGVVSRADLEARTPLGRLAYPEDLAGLVLFLASHEAGMLTGTTIALDGGWSVSG